MDIKENQKEEDNQNKKSYPVDFLKFVNIIKRHPIVAMGNVAFSFFGSVILVLYIDFFQKHFFYYGVFIFLVLWFSVGSIMWVMYKMYKTGYKIADRFVRKIAKEEIGKEKREEDNQIEELGYSPKVLFEFNKKIFGYYYKRKRLKYNIKEDGSVEVCRTVCIVGTDGESERGVKTKDYLSTANDFFLGGDNIINSNTDKINKIDTIGIKICQKCQHSLRCGGNCEYYNKSTKAKEVSIKTILSTKNVTIRRYIFDDELRKGDIIRFNVHGDNFPAGTLLIKKENNTDDSIKNNEECKKEIFFEVTDPIEYLEVEVMFPAFFKDVKFRKEVVLPDDWNYKIDKERRRMHDPNKEAESDGTTLVKAILKIDHPVIGLRYKIKWDPPLVNLK